MSYIETERLIVRTWLLRADVEPLAAMYGDPEVVAMLPFGVRTVEQTSDVIARMAAEYEREGLSLWPVVLKSSSALIGTCGLMGTRASDSAELGFAFGRAYWGQGYAYEAARATIDFGLRTLGKRKISALVVPENQRCIRLVNRLGMRFDRVVRANRRDVLRYVAS